jgi:hypothetical protein
MGRNCTICCHAQQKQIDALLLVRSHGYRVVAKRFGLHPAAMYRHLRSHLPRYLLQAKQATDVLDATRLVQRLQSLHAETSEILKEARRARDLKTALQAIARLENQIGLVNMLASASHEVKTLDPPSALNLKNLTRDELRFLLSILKKANGTAGTPDAEVVDIAASPLLSRLALPAPSSEIGGDQN